jgi:hypothetical protein
MSNRLTLTRVIIVTVAVVMLAVAGIVASGIFHTRLRAADKAVAALPLVEVPSRWAGFQFHPIDLVQNIHRAGDLPVVPAIERLRGMSVLCIYGRRDATTICPRLDPALARPVVRDGGHGLSAREGRALADTTLSELGRRYEPPSDS